MSLSFDVNVENEQVILAALIRDSATWERELVRLQSHLFLDPDHRKLVDAFQQLRSDGAGYAADTVVQLTAEAVSLKYLRQLEQDFDTLTETQFQIHLGILKRETVKHKATKHFADLYEHLDDAHAGLDTTEEAAFNLLRTIREGRQQEEARATGEEVFVEWAAELDAARKDRATRFKPLHFTGLDEHLFEGLKAGNLVVIAARPGMGKTTLCSNLILRQVLRGSRVLAVPVEPGRQTLIDQMACSRARIDAEKLIKLPDELTATEVRQLKAAAAKILTTEALVIDDHIATLDDLEVRLEEAEQRFDVVVIDLFEYLIPGEKKPAIITDALRRTRNLARRYNTCMVLVHQIRRIDRKGNPRPQLHELKNSGGYEEVADLALLLHRKKYFDPDSDDEDILEIWIGKQRRGPQNLGIGFDFQPELSRVGGHNPNADLGG